MKAHLWKSGIDGDKVNTVCGRIVSIWAVVYFKLRWWRNCCKTCRKIYYLSPSKVR